MKLRQSFTDFIFATNTDGSGKTVSYVRALDMLGPILTKHYLVPVVKEIKDHYTDAAARSYFLDREGQTISLPTKFLPSQALLEKHRALLVG